MHRLAHTHTQNTQNKNNDNNNNSNNNVYIKKQVTNRKSNINTGKPMKTFPLGFWS